MKNPSKPNTEWEKMFFLSSETRQGCPLSGNIYEVLESLK